MRRLLDRIRALESRLLPSGNHHHLSREELDAKAEQMRSEGRRVVVCYGARKGEPQIIELVAVPTRGAIEIQRSYGNTSTQDPSGSTGTAQAGKSLAEAQAVFNRVERAGGGPLYSTQ